MPVPVTRQKRWMLEVPYFHTNPYPIGSMYGIYANIWGILMVNVTIYSLHGSYGYDENVQNWMVERGRI
jgi:hypothetical protein